MLGAFRLILALAVAASHAGYYPFSLNPGVAAVVGFYLISGYVMAGLIQRYYAQREQIPAFYVDRSLRIFPQYLLYAGLALAWQRLTQTHTPFLQRTPDLVDLLNNLLIVPLNYYMINGSDSYSLVPPAWSLGAELQFYLIAPLFLLKPGRMLAVASMSLAVFALAVTGILDSDWYGYRLLPGVLIFFICGAVLYHLHRSGKRHLAALLVAGGVIAALAAAWFLKKAHLLFRPYNQEILIGFSLALPLLHLLGTRKRHVWDERLGDLSYGVFLNHFCVLWIAFPRGVSPAALPLFLVMCMALSALSQRYVERPILRWRQRLRRDAAALKAADCRR